MIHQPHETRFYKCRHCENTGVVDCDDCAGKGYEFNELGERVECVYCNGEGEVECYAC